MTSEAQGLLRSVLFGLHLRLLLAQTANIHACDALPSNQLNWVGPTKLGAKLTCSRLHVWRIRMETSPSELITRAQFLDSSRCSDCIFFLTSTHKSDAGSPPLKLLFTRLLLLHHPSSRWFRPFRIRLWHSQLSTLKEEGWY